MSAGHGFPTLSTGKNIACVSCTLYNMFSLEAYPSAPQGGLMSSKQVSAATRASASQFVSRCVLVALLSSTLATWTLTTHHPLRWTSFAIVSFAYIYIYLFVFCSGHLQPGLASTGSTIWSWTTMDGRSSRHRLWSVL